MAKSKKEKATNLPSRPPVVTIMGHIDHGKTTLLDAIRETHVAAKEHGGITQHIGAYQAQVNDRLITFIDTPGHAAFEEMRKRGAHVADVVVLVVAADDGVKPQTVEAIKHIQAAGVPFVVAINKIDVEGANLDRVKRGLAEQGVLVEGYGGNVVAVSISAKTKQGISELLDMILLVSDLGELKNQTGGSFQGVIIESRLDRFRGPVATVLVQKGTLASSETIHAGRVVGRVRAMVDANGRQVKEALPSAPVEVMGWEAVPEVGAIVASGKVTDISHEEKQEASEVWQIPDENHKEVNVIVRSDVKGSLEAILAGLAQITLEETPLTIIASSTGDISESDVLLARSTGAFIIGFNVKILPGAQRLADTEKVIIRTYSIIYELLDEVAEVLAARGVPQKEVVLGQGEVIAVFEGPNKIAGVKVTKGVFKRGERVVILREDTIVGEAVIKSIRRVKEDVQKAAAPAECGMLFDVPLDFQRGDKLESKAP